MFTFCTCRLSLAFRNWLLCVCRTNSSNNEKSIKFLVGMTSTFPLRFSNGIEVSILLLRIAAKNGIGDGDETLTKVRILWLSSFTLIYLYLFRTDAPSDESGFHSKWDEKEIQHQTNWITISPLREERGTETRIACVCASDGWHQNEYKRFVSFLTGEDDNNILWWFDWASSSS